MTHDQLKEKYLKNKQEFEIEMNEKLSNHESLIFEVAFYRGVRDGLKKIIDKMEE